VDINSVNATYSGQIAPAIHGGALRVATYIRRRRTAAPAEPARRLSVLVQKSGDLTFDRVCGSRHLVHVIEVSRGAG
jgi:hypothetical protein